MGHQSIAILKSKRQNSNTDSHEDTFIYLVQKTANDQYKFFDYTSNIIGDSFDYTSFKKRINKTFELESDIKGEPFKVNRKDQYSSCYQYTLADVDVQNITEKIESGVEFWKDLVWFTGKELLDVKYKWIDSQNFIFDKEGKFEDPKFSNQFRVNLKNIVKAKERGKLVIFAGAGISLDSNTPLWSELIDGLKADLNNPQKDYLEVAQQYYKERKNKEYQERIKEVLKHQQTRYNPIHEKILELQPAHIVTTNYDNHFEQVMEQKGYSYSIVKKDTDLPYSPNSTMFIKMHGDFEERNIILTSDDYEYYAQQFPLIEGYINGIFASKLVLFVGFSFKDSNITHIFEYVQDKLKKDSQPPYVFVIPTIDPQKRIEELEFYNKLRAGGINVIEVEEEPLNTYYEQIDLQDDKDRIQRLSQHGAIVYKFLRVIEEFDIVSDSIESLEIKHQLTNSVLRFEEFGVIPKKTIEAISPFKIKNQSKFQNFVNAKFSENYLLHLETLNEELLDYLKTLKNVEGNIDVYQSIDSSKSSADKKLNKAFKLLMESGVHCIIRKSDTEPEHNHFSVIKAKKDCDCPDCLANRFEYSSLLNYLYSLFHSIANENNVELGLKEAYAYLRTGQMHKSFLLLDVIKTNALKSGRYITYFLACVNQKLMHHFINGYFYDRSMTDTEREKIKERINTIDLDKILYELPVDQVTKKALTYVKENRIYEDTRNNMQKSLNHIKDRIKLYQNGGYSVGEQSEATQVEVDFHYVYAFYFKNFLFYANYGYFSDLAKLYTECLIASNSLPLNNKERYNSFNTFFIKICICDISTDDLQTIFDSYSFNSINLREDSDQDKIIEWFVHFTKSSYTESNFFNRVIEPNGKFALAVSLSSAFDHSTQTIFRNFLLIFSKLDLTTEQSTLIFNQTLDYLEISNQFNDFRSIQPIEALLDRNVSKLTDDNLRRVIRYVLSDNLWPETLAKPICSTIAKSKRTNLIDTKLYQTILRRAEERESFDVDLFDLRHFFDLLNSDHAKDFKERLRTLLSDSYRIQYAYYSNIWTPKTDPDIWEKYTNLLVAKCNGYSHSPVGIDGLPINIKNFDGWNDLIFFSRMVYTYNLFEESIVQEIVDIVDSDLFKWILNPTQFNYEKFELNWLVTFDRDYVFKELKRIDQFRDAVYQGLKENYHDKIAKIYFEKIEE